MPAGLHTVMVHSDPAAGGWSAPIASNPYLTTDAAGWRQQPFTTPWTWAGGQVSGGTALGRADTHPVPRVAAALYRLRVTFSVSLQTNVFWGINLGTTPWAAETGPYWQPDDSVNLWQGRTYLPGRYTVESTWDPSTIDPRYIYLGPNVSMAGEGQQATVSTIELTYQVGGGVDISCLVDSVSIHHGRDDSESQPEASSATIDLTSDPVMPLPPQVDVGASVVVTTVSNGITFQRFVGRVTDLALGWDDAGADTPDSGVGQIVAVGSLADLGRRVVGAVPFPQELDGARVSRVLSAAGVALDPAYSDPGTVQLLPRDIDSQQALDVAHDAATTASGVLYQTRDGELRYADADHRRGTTSSLTLDACDILVTPTWRRTIEGLVNQVSVGYGVAPEGSEQPRFDEAAPTSIARWGTYSYTAATALAALADAQAIGRLLLARNSSPVWVMAALPVDVAGLTQPEYEALLGLDMHSLLVLTGLPSLGTAPTSATLWVEGWKETLAYGVHDIELVVSGYCRTAPPPRWDDIDPQWLWGGTVIVGQRQNIVPNPALRAGLSGVYSDGTVTLSTVDGKQWVSTTGGSFVQVASDAGVVGGWYAASVLVGGPAGATYSLDSSDYTVSNFVEPKGGTIPASGSVRVSMEALHQVSGTHLVVTLYSPAPVRITEVAIVPVAQAGALPGAYFDGSTPDSTGTDYAWLGTPDASASVETISELHPGGVPPELTWDEAACLGPPSNLGRWNDQPATLRWDAVAPSLTWDTYR
jgi:hypothetical protein